MKYSTVYMTIVTSMMFGGIIGIEVTKKDTFFNNHKGASILLMVIISMIASQIIVSMSNKKK